MSDPLPDAIRAFFHDIAPPDALRGPLIVGVSGGPDSVALLHALRDQAPELGITLHAAHLHHGQRANADADAHFVESLARAWGIPCAVERVTVPELARAERVSTEMAGRLARYRFFARLAERLGSHAVAVAHHADDQAETVLMRALRGAGTPGLRGIPAVGPLPESGGKARVLRPLLSVSRREIEAYGGRHGLATRLDSTNRDRRMTRNRVRLDLLPLAESVSPGARRGLLRLAREALEDEAILSTLANAALARCVTYMEEGAVVSREALPPEAALRRRVLRALAEALDPSSSWKEETMDRLLAALERTEPVASFDLPHGFRARLDSARLTLDRAPSVTLSLPPPPIPLLFPGVTQWGDGVTFTAKRLAHDSDLIFPPRDALDCVMDADACAMPLIARCWEPGDRMKVLGKGGTRKLQALFTEARVPPALRRRWPLVCDANGIVWAPGLALADGVKVTLTTSAVLRLRISRLPEDA